MNENDAFSSRDRWRKANKWEQNIPDERLDDIFDPMENRGKSKSSYLFAVIVGVFTIISVYALCLYAVSSVLEWGISYWSCLAVSSVFCVFRYTDAGIIKRVNEQ
jgi:hypothetical protein